MENVLNIYSEAFLDRLPEEDIILSEEPIVVAPDGSFALYSVEVTSGEDFLATANEFALNNYPNEFSTPTGSTVQIVLVEQRAKSFKGVTVDIAFIFFKDGEGQEMLLVRILGGKVYTEGVTASTKDLRELADLVSERDTLTIDRVLPSIEEGDI